MAEAVYNELAPYPAAWLRNLIAAGHIAPGRVLEKSIAELGPDDVRGPGQRHFFAGLGGWSHALRLAGVADDASVWTASCPCFVPGTLILTQRGLVAIENVVVGDLVMTHRNRWRPVTSVMRSEKETLVLKGQGHWGIETTAEHPFLTGPDEWTEAAKMPGKRWACAIRVPALTVPCLPEKTWQGKSQDADVETPGFWRFVGYWLGDGWTRDREQIVLCGSRDDGDLLMSLAAGAGLHGSLSIEPTGCRLRIGAKLLAQWLDDNFGHGALTKTVPSWLLGCPNDQLREFLAGLMMADGHDEQGGNVQRLTTASRAIAVGVRIIANRLGISASIGRHDSNRVCVIEGRTVTERGYYRVTMYHRARSFRFGDGFGWGVVRTATPTGSARVVHNIAVAEDESYVADGVVVHNCQPFSAAGRRGGTSDERHLWPVLFALIRECRPHLILGEQVSSRDGLAWLDAVCADLEGAGYAVGALDTCAAGVGAPHIRQRLYFCAVAHASGSRHEGGEVRGGYRGDEIAGSRGLESERSRQTRGLGNADQPQHGRGNRGVSRSQAETLGAIRDGDRDHDAVPSGQGVDPWSDAQWIACTDGRARPAQPGSFPLADGVPTRVGADGTVETRARVGELAGYGNAIVTEQAATFIRCVMDELAGQEAA